MGVFFIRLTEFDAKNPDRYGEELDKRVVLVTDLGLLIKHQADSSQQVFVMSVATGKPVAGAKVELLGKNGVVVLSGTTNAQGSVNLDKTSGFVRERQPVVYLVSRSSNGVTDSSFIPYDRYSRQLDYSKFNTSGRYQDENSAKALSAYMFSDRGIYRPGEQVQLAAIIRHSDLSLAEQKLPLKIQVQGPRGSTFWQQNFSLSGRGMHTFSLDTQPHSDTGNYNANISLLDSKGNTERHLGSVSFVVEEFQPDTLKISSSFNQQGKGWLSPQNLVAQVQLDNLFGTPAQQRRVTGLGVGGGHWADSGAASQQALLRCSPALMVARVIGSVIFLIAAVNSSSVVGTAIALTLLVDALIGFRLNSDNRFLNGLAIEGTVTNLFDEEYVGTIGSNGFGLAGDNQTLLAGAPQQFFVTLRKDF